MLGNNIFFPYYIYEKKFCYLAAIDQRKEIMLELKSYTAKELCEEVLMIKYSSFKQHKKDYLNKLSQCCSYTIGKAGNAYIYTITEVYCQYESPTSEAARNRKVISDFVSDMIDAEPYHTPSSLGRRATYDEEVKKTKYAQSTIKEYVKIDLRTKYYIKERLWGKVLDIDTPEEVVSPLEDNELQTLKDLFKKYGSEKMEKDGALLEEYNEGMITREEYLESLGDANAAFFNNAKTEFSKIYGFKPIRIGVYDRTAY